MYVCCMVSKPADACQGSQPCAGSVFQAAADKLPKLGPPSLSYTCCCCCPTVPRGIKEAQWAVCTFCLLAWPAMSAKLLPCLQAEAFLGGKGHCGLHSQSQGPAQKLPSSLLPHAGSCSAFVQPPLPEVKHMYSQPRCCSSPTQPAVIPYHLQWGLPSAAAGL